MLSTKSSENDKLKLNNSLDLDDQSHDGHLGLDHDHEVDQQVEVEYEMQTFKRRLMLDNGPMMPISRRTMKPRLNKGVEVEPPKPRSYVETMVSLCTV